MKVYEDFCSGCGLCGAILGIEFIPDEKGFPSPILREENAIFCSKYCPASGNVVQGDDGGIWGRYVNACYTYSKDDSIRNHSSSGGSITAVCIYLLENNLVDGIIQTCSDKDNPIKTITTVSCTKEQVISCSGSRYTISQPLTKVLEIIEKGKKYAFVGKPCDVRSLRLYLRDNKELNEQIPFILSFFCAGVPSIDAESKLLHRLGCKDINDVLELTYRGDGWPGKTILKQKNNQVSSIKYEEAWGDILGRDVRRSCRYCLDGVGKAADISFGDGWYLDEQGHPIFRNQNGGRNCTLIRNEKGKDLITKVSESGYIVCEKMQNPELTLKKTQPYQFERSSCMKSMLLALSLLRKNTPYYNKVTLRRLSKLVPFKTKVRRFLGTIKRNI